MSYQTMIRYRDLNACHWEKPIRRLYTVFSTIWCSGNGKTMGTVKRWAVARGWGREGNTEDSWVCEGVVCDVIRRDTGHHALVQTCWLYSTRSGPHVNKWCTWSDTNMSVWVHQLWQRYHSEGGGSSWGATYVWGQGVHGKFLYPPSILLQNQTTLKE